MLVLSFIGIASWWHYLYLCSPGIIVVLCNQSSRTSDVPQKYSLMTKNIIFPDRDRIFTFRNSYLHFNHMCTDSYQSFWIVCFPLYFPRFQMSRIAAVHPHQILTTPQVRCFRRDHDLSRIQTFAISRRGSNSELAWPETIGT